jgi:hypothetical protein
VRLNFKLSEQGGDLRGQFSGGFNFFEGEGGGGFAGSDGQQLFAFELTAARGTRGIERALAVAGIESGAGLGDTRAVLGEERGAVTAFTAHVGEEDAAAAEAALKAEVFHGQEPMRTR